MSTPTPAATPEVTDQPTRNRYEATVDREHAGFAAYRLDGATITFTHTLVDSAFEGRGVGSALARHALDDARRRQLSVVPRCPFIRAWIDRHPNYADLVTGTEG
jgi:predicted GNAT family acetyltransferase